MPLPDKFFHERENHFDVRYFRQRLDQPAVLGSLRLLFREFSQVMSGNGIPFFLMHGTLLGWYWNRGILPWDSDIDVGVAAASLALLDELAPRLGHPRCVLEVNPHYVDRRSLNRSPAEDREPNRIDARFIDRETGLFIDITGFADAGAGLVASKCPHVFPAACIFPLRPSRFEGVETFVPRNVIPLLHCEYGDRCTKRVRFNGYRWDRQSGAWLEEPDLAGRSRPASAASTDTAPAGDARETRRSLLSGSPFESVAKRDGANLLPLQYYRRTVASWPAWKKLMPVRDEADAPLPFGSASGQLCGEVLFTKLLDPATGRTFWAKRQVPPSAREHSLELGLCEELVRLDLKGACVPEFSCEQHGLVFPFREELFAGTVVHLCNVRQFFSLEELRSIEIFAGTVVDHPTLGKATIAELTDFQTVRTSAGLTFIDFTLWPGF